MTTWMQAKELKIKTWPARERKAIERKLAKPFVSGTIAKKDVSTIDPRKKGFVAKPWGRPSRLKLAAVSRAMHDCTTS